MTCKRCKFYKMGPRKCGLKGINKAAWDTCQDWERKGA